MLPLPLTRSLMDLSSALSAVANELLPLVYACRALSEPLETIAFVAVFEFRGKFF